MSSVIIQECRNYALDAMIDKLDSGIELLGGWDKFIRPGMTVLLKANLVSPKTAESAAVTHSEFIRALIRILKKRQCKVWVGDSSGGGILGAAMTTKSLEVSGINTVAAEEGAEVKNFDREGVLEIDRPGMPGKTILLAKPVFEADFIINLPKLKTHMFGMYTGAVKNLFGCIPGFKKAYYHKATPSPKEFGKILASVNETVKPGLHIMDAITAMDGEGPTAGRPYHAGKIFMSTDPLALDAVACKMINLDIRSIPIFHASIERGIGEWKLADIKVSGDYSSPPSLHRFRLPPRFLANTNYPLLARLTELFKTRPKIDMKLCKSCSVCVESCPAKAIGKDTKAIDYSKCIECLCCHELCVHKAVKLEKIGLLARLPGKKSWQ